jgi:carbamoyltransferase
MYILGISAFYHDSAAALIKDGELVAAASEERFTRKKHDPDFPAHAVRFCLEHARIKPSDLTYVGFYDKPFVKFERLISTYIDFFPRGLSSFVKAIPVWLREKLWIKTKIQEELGDKAEVLFSEHHLSHAASAFLVSPFQEAAILTVDGVGEWSTATRGVGRGNDIELYHEIRFPHSLGLLYSAFTYYLGFKVNSAEYKVMGLAPYGEPIYYDQIRRELIDVKDDGSFVMNMKYFAYPYGLTMTNRKFDELFGGPPFPHEKKPVKKQMDLAASVQKVTDEIMTKLAHTLYKETKMKNLCLAGGVALNCVANGHILRECPFEDLWVQPAAGDAGGAVGVGYYIWNTVLGNPRTYRMHHAYYGPEYSADHIRRFLDGIGAPYKEFDREGLIAETARLIDEQNVVGWFQGRMEWGPRSLGSRSILGDARSPEMQTVMNLKIKFRESFRPFAPTVLHERTHEWFEFDDTKHESPYMLLVCQVRRDRFTNGKSMIPAVTHVDGSARIQTLRREDNPLYYDLIKAFEARTGCPVIINTSFNVRGEPIVCSPEHAYVCFMRTNMDALVLDKFVLYKKDQPPLRDDIDWQKEFELD